MHMLASIQATKLESVLYVQVIKNGVAAEAIELDPSKDHWVVGRLPTCDVTPEHPTLSRYHAILQHSTDGELGFCRLFLFCLH